MNIKYEKLNVEDKEAVFAFYESSGLLVDGTTIDILDSGYYCVAKDNEKIIGAAGYDIIKSSPSTTYLFVSDDYREHGIGKELQTMRMNMAIEDSHTHIHTGTISNSAAEWYIKHFGYSVVRKFRTATVLTCDLLKWKNG